MNFDSSYGELTEYHLTVLYMKIWMFCIFLYKIYIILQLKPEKSFKSSDYKLLSLKTCMFICHSIASLYKYISWCGIEGELKSMCKQYTTVPAQLHKLVRVFIFLI